MCVSKWVLIQHIMHIKSFWKASGRYVRMTELCVPSYYMCIYIHTLTQRYICASHVTLFIRGNSKKTLSSPFLLFWSIWGGHLSTLFCKWWLCLKRQINWFPWSATFLEKNLSIKENRKKQNPVCLFFKKKTVLSILDEKLCVNMWQTSYSAYSS